jgi:putative transposase
MGKILLAPDKFYHIYNHACGDEDLFRVDDNYLYFLQKFSDHVSPVSNICAYCLMPNHFHFLLQMKPESEIVIHLKEKYSNRIYFRNKSFKNNNCSNEEGLGNILDLIAQQFSNFFNAYTKAYNNLCKRKGNLFLVNFRRKEINDLKYLKETVRYIHLNPLHHQFVENLKEWKYSSYQSFFSSKPSKVKRKMVIEWFEDIDNFRAFHNDGPNGFEPEFD